MLRFICPAIVAPQKYNLVKDASINSLRTLMLISKIVQTIANHNEFESTYMTSTNSLIVDSFPAMMSFLTKLGTVSKPTTKPKIKL